MSRTIHLAHTLTEMYVRPFSVMLASLLGTRTSRDPLVLHILDNGVKAETRRAIEEAFAGRQVTFSWVPLQSSALNSAGVRAGQEPVMYETLLLPLTLPESIDRIIFLDADLVFLRPVEDLWETTLDGRPLAAAQDMAIPTVSSRQGVKDLHARGLSADAPYSNAGVMVIDLSVWRSTRVSERAVEYLRANRGRVSTHAQDAYNATVCDWKRLPLAWNVIASLAGRPFFAARGLDRREYEDAVAHPAILHFAGRFKPWLTRTGGRFDESFRLWRDRVPVFHRLSKWDKPADHAAGYYDRALRPLLYRVERFFWERRP